MTDLTPSTTRQDKLWFVNGHVSVKVAQADNADRLSVLEHILPFNEAPPRHVHHDEDEVFHILAGEIRYELGDEIIVGRAGDTVLAPRGVPHGFRVISPEGARVLTVSRGGFETMVRNASRPAETDAPPPTEEPTPEMQAALATFCAAEGIELLGPPIP